MGVKISKRYSPHSYDSFSTKRFLKIPCDSPHKVTYRNFEISKFKSIEIFVNMGPIGSGNFKTLVLLKFCSFWTKRFLNVPCDSPHKSYL